MTPIPASIALPLDATNPKDKRLWRMLNIMRERSSARTWAAFIRLMIELQYERMAESGGVPRV